MSQYDYGSDHRKRRHNASIIFTSSGLPLVTAFFPELFELHEAGHNVAALLVGLVLYVLWAAVFLAFIARPIRKKVYGVRKQDFRIEGLILLFALIAALTAYARYKLGWYVTF